jgi:hypothetical protein
MPRRMRLDVGSAVSLSPRLAIAAEASRGYWSGARGKKGRTESWFSTSPQRGFWTSEPGASGSVQTQYALLAQCGLH